MTGIFVSCTSWHGQTAT